MPNTHRIAGFAHSAASHQVADLSREAVHKIQDAVNDTSGDVAPQRADGHRAHVVVARLRTLSEPVKVRTMIRPKSTSRV
jgi:hypothetical protein